MTGFVMNSVEHYGDECEVTDFVEVLDTLAS